MVASGVTADRVLVVPNGVDVDKFVPARRLTNPDVPTLICVAALRPEKGVGRLIGLMAKLLERRAARLVIVGDGAERSMIKGLIAAHSIDEHVELLGMREDIPQLLQQADILVSTAYVEGFGIAVAEGAAAGLPVVAFDVQGGLRDLIHHQQTGFLVPPSRDDLFVAALEQLCSDPEMRRRFGSAGRDHIVKNFSLQATVPLLDRALTQWD
jgi:glycosyltransferase involved in cell wall biosynthesis